MKTLFIHFSDIHLKESFDSDDSCDLLFKAIAPSLDETGRVFLLFTGDMARRAKDTEVDYFDSFISKIKSKIEKYTKRKIELFIVPGNHDIKLLGDYKLDELIKANEQELDALAVESVAGANYCLSKCRKYDCFVNNDFVSIKTVKYENIIYRFTLINSSPLSSLKKNDKGHHHIPAEYLSFDTSTEHKRKTVDVILSHHRPDWFDEANYSVLDSFISRNISLAFFGHEHSPSSYTYGKDGRVVFVSKGGELKPKETIVYGSFSLLVFDEESFIAEEKIVNINYQSKTINYNELVSQPVCCSESYPMQSSFVSRFLQSPLKNGEGNLLDFFVFPALSQQTIRNDILTIDSALTKAKDKGLMVLCGGTRSGKTTLLKAMYWELQKEQPCIFVNATSDLSNNVERNIKNAFQDIYGDDNSLWINYKNLKKEEKAIFIDNFASLRKRSIKEECLKYCLDNFGVVVLTYYDNSQPIDSLEDRIIFGEESVYKIEGLTAKSRLKLVNNICSIKKIPEDDAEKIANLYDTMAVSTKILDFIDPDYAIQLIESIIDNKLYVERRVHDAFSAVFSTSINNDIIRAGSRDCLDGVLAVLRIIAYKTWSEKQCGPFSESEIRECYDCAKNKGLIKIDYISFLNIILDSGVIIKNDSESNQFKRNSFLSFFAAKEIAVKMSRGRNEDITNLLENIHVGINSDILLFLCYDLSRIDVLFNINNKLVDLLASLEEIDFEKKNNKILMGNGLIPEEADTNKQTKRDLLEQKEAAERQYIDSKRKQEPVAFDEDMDDDFKQIIVCVKYLEIISKAAGSFPGLLEDEEREQLTNTIVSSINKLIQFAYNPSKELILQYSELLDEYKAVETERIIKSGSGDIQEKVNLINSIKVEDYLFADLLKMLTMLDSAFANFMASQHSMKAISKLPSDKFAYSTFKLYSYLYYGSFDRFYKELKTASDTFKTQRGDNLYKFFGRIYVLKNRCTSEEIDKIASLTGLQKTYLLKIASREETLSIQHNDK